jgi:hypothetical protein
MSVPWKDIAIVSVLLLHFVNQLIHFWQIGISTEFPSGPHSDHNLTHPEFFEFLLDKKLAYERIPAERFDIDQSVSVHIIILNSRTPLRPMA